MDLMNISLMYILERFAFRIYYFLYHWYVRGFRKAANWTLNYLEALDYKFALKINLKNIFQPLYQDYSFVGHVMGFVLRSLRILIAAIIYVAIVIISAVIFLAWAAVPLFAIYQIIINFPH
jgi:hypothetical protein